MLSFERWWNIEPCVADHHRDSDHLDTGAHCRCSEPMAKPAGTLERWCAGTIVREQARLREPRIHGTPQALAKQGLCYPRSDESPSNRYGSPAVCSLGPTS